MSSVIRSSCSDGLRSSQVEVVCSVLFVLGVMSVLLYSTSELRKSLSAVARFYREAVWLTSIRRSCD